MKKKIFLAVAFLAISLLSFSETKLTLGGDASFNYRQFSEKDGLANYSMNGHVFGIGDWKESTSDSNTNQFYSQLNLNLKAVVNKKIVVEATLEPLKDYLDGANNGDATTFSHQHLLTVRDNPKLMLRDLTITANDDLATMIITNNFNYNFNNRVLSTQFDDAWAEMIPYGEGILVKTDKIFNTNTQAFVYQVNVNKTDKGTTYAAGDAQKGLDIQQMVYGVDVKNRLRYLGINTEVLAIRTHDRKSDIAGADFHKKLDNTHISLKGKIKPIKMITLNGEYIKAYYGKDVKTIYKTTGPTWDTEAAGYAVGTDKERKDTSIVELGATLKPIKDLKVTGTYRNVGEDYIAVDGNGHNMDWWGGDDSFGDGQQFDVFDGVGYEKGIKVNADYKIPFMFTPKLSAYYTDYAKTRSHLDQVDNIKDDEETILGSSLNFNIFNIQTGVSYKYKKDLNSETSLDVNQNDFNVNGKYNLIKGKSLTLNINGSANIYKVDDQKFKDTNAKKNIANEFRVKAGADATYKMSRKISFIGNYTFGAAEDKNDLIDGIANQNMIKTSVQYKVTSTATLNLYYKYDVYSFDVVEKQKGGWADSFSEGKDVGHLWYDGQESWQGRDASYKGYTTNEIGTSMNIKF